MTAMLIPALSVEESDELEAHEYTIERGLKTFYEVGEALMAIRDRGLFRGSHGSFEDYCRDRWHMVGSRARQLIAASQAVAAIGVTVVTPGNEAQVRPLVALDPEQQREAWSLAVETAPAGRVTAAHVAAVVEQIRQPDRMAVHYSSASPEWYTPAHIVAAVASFFDAIDLDPCAEDGDPKTVPAARHFTAADDGLAREWFGRVYMNPPYGDAIGAWVAKAVASYDSRAIEAAILLVPARVDTAWFRQLDRFALCFINGRLKFGGHEDSAPFPSALVYLGDEIDRYTAAVAHLGRVFLLHTTEAA